jgi:hypothetical protein
MLCCFVIDIVCASRCGAKYGICTQNNSGAADGVVVQRHGLCNRSLLEMHAGVQRAGNSEVMFGVQRSLKARGDGHKEEVLPPCLPHVTQCPGIDYLGQ